MQSGSSVISWFGGSSAESQCLVVSSARSSPDESSPVRTEFVASISTFSSPGLNILEDRRRCRIQQPTKLAEKVISGISIPMAILPTLPKPLLLGFVSGEEVGIAVVGELSLVVSTMEELETIADLTAWVLR